MGIILFLMVIFFITVISNKLKYKIKLIYRDCKMNYSIRISFFFNIIAIMAEGTNENVRIFVKVMFFKKKLKTDFKKQGQNNVDVGEKVDDTPFHIVNTVKMIYRNRNYLGKFISIIKPESIKIEGIYGFEDPYITGILSGFIAAVSLLLPAHSVKLKSDFFNKVFNLKVKIQGRTRIILLIVLVCKFLIYNVYENIMVKLKDKRLSMRRTRFKSKKLHKVKLH